ncbi:MAG TPA: sigma factor-like helix-turn-helix DNA-binding protein [Candidatus Angelobacter sp.]|nr:sigma factor-like helix-turn-helix DNA-binding protein [Candidatus Angelobacter sp.]
MNVHVSYKAGKTPDVEREFQHQLQRLNRRLQLFKPDLVSFHAIVEQENHHSASTSLNLRLPSGQIAAQKSGENALAAVKAAFADLLSQLNKHKDLLRGQWTRQSRRAARERAAEVPALPPLEPVPSRGQRTRPSPPQSTAQSATDGASPGNIETWLSTNLRKLEEYIDRELDFQVAADRIREGQITREEVLDEVIVSALSQENSASQWLSLESWFHRLALQAVRRLIAANADTGNISLDAPAGIQNVTGSDENFMQYHQPDDTLAGENIIRDQSVRTPEEIFAGDEMVAQLDIVLRGVQAEDREAFVLYTLEGFTVEEISRLAGRSPDHVRQSIQHTRSHIQQKLPAQNQFRQSLLQHSRVA